MNKIILFSLFILLFSGISAQTKEDAINFNDKIVGDQKKMLILEDLFVTAVVNDKGGDTIQLTYEIYCDFLQFTLNKYSKMKKFDKKDTFRKALVELFTNFQNVAKTEYKELLEIYSIPAADLTDDDFKRWTELAKIIKEKENLYNNTFLEAQIVFAKEYEFSLSE